MLLTLATLVLVSGGALPPAEPAESKPAHYTWNPPKPCKLGCAALFAGSVVFDEGTTLYGESRGRLREIGPLRDARVRLAFKGGLAVLWWKAQGKSRIVRFGVPALFLLEGFHNVMEIRRAKPSR